MVENVIANKRLRMDEALSNLFGIQFFFSSITGTRNKSKKKTNLEENDAPQCPEEDEEEKLRSFYSGVSYFISYKRMQPGDHFCVTS